MPVSTTRDLDADLTQPITNCMATWGQNDCPNVVTHVVINAEAAGYCAVCEPHANGWPRRNIEAGHSLIVELEEFNSLRARGLYTKYSLPSEVPS